MESSDVCEYLLSDMMCIQVCGFIALYLHLAEVARMTCTAHPRCSLGTILSEPSSLPKSWRSKTYKEAPPALAAGFIMWAALAVHQASAALAGEPTSSLQTAPSSSAAAAAVAAAAVGEEPAQLPEQATSLAQLDKMAHTLYRRAREVVENLAGRDVTYLPSSYYYWDAERTVKELLGELKKLGSTMAYMHVRSDHLPHGVSAHAQAARQVWDHAGALLHEAESACTTIMQWKPDSLGGFAEDHAALSAAIHASRSTAIHPALIQGDGLDWSLERDEVITEMNEKGDLKGTCAALLGALDAPTPYSLLRTFPPAPSSPEEWSTSCYTNASPVKPRVPHFIQLIKRVDECTVATPITQAPDPPGAGATAAEVAEYVSRLEAPHTLGPVLHALVPHAAVLALRPSQTWVRNT
jgi:hypothetical protein